MVSGCSAGPRNPRHIDVDRFLAIAQLVEYAMADLTNPSILPASTSVTDARWSCGPPCAYWLVLWYGRTQCPSTGSGTHGSGVPSGRIGIPSAPGNVPK